MSEQQENTANNRISQSDKNQKFLEKLQIVVGIMVAVFGLYTSWQSTIAAQNSQKLAERVQEIERTQKFAELIQQQLNNLAGEETKAKIALMSLYALAESNKEKIILFRIAVSSQNKELTSTISDLIADDPSVAADFENEIFSKLARIQTVENLIIVPTPESPKIETYDPVEIETSPEKKLLQQLTQEQSNVEGWIYLGKVDRGSQTLENDKTIKQDTIPKKQTIIESITSINLRVGGRASSPIRGIIAPDSRLEVQEIKKIPIDEYYEAIWAKILQHSAN
ncbi:hypothetical protein [Roseofilum sp. Guam]|uniref:hypothetical protein n=1 Tax=Roseofilum sp. Guam TaxID=2821502 RepID=UPI001B0982E5|nr:hypothetical protein [Roseofilum sp. Guam]MBP0029176.1 hypothetical protein [Roseofilum sp. Guam]